MKTLLRSLGHVAQTRVVEALGGVPPGPMMAYVELTRRCNLRCRQCEIWKTTARSPDFLREEMDPALNARVLGEMQAMGLVAVDFIGGEPLLRDDLEAVVAQARELGLHVTVTTNGWALDAARARRLAEAGVGQLLVSLDGPDAALHDSLRGRAGSFDRALAGLRHLRAAAPEIDLGLNVVISRANVARLGAIVSLAIREQVDTLRFLPVHDCYPFAQFDGADPELRPRPAEARRLARELPVLRKRLRRAGIATNARPFLAGIPDFFRDRRPAAPCAAGYLVCDIVANGDLVTCFGRDGIVGNVREAPFPELWRRPVLAAHRELLRKEGCTLCWQSCYLEPAQRTRLRAALADPVGLYEELRRYLL